MAETSIQSDTDLPEGCGYNKIFEHQWRTHVYALPLSAINVIKKIALDKWGWHFIPHKNMQWEKDDWFKDQTLVLSFSDKDDLINCRFSIDLN